MKNQIRRNKVKLNEFHQIKRKKKGNNPKKKLRDMQRLMNNPKIDQKFKEEKEREIEKLKENLGKTDKIKEKKDRKLFFLKQKYDKIRNIENVKLKRKLKQKQKEISLEKNPTNLKALEDEKNEIIDKLNYTKFFPKDKKYISLFPKKNSVIDPKALEMQLSISQTIKKNLGNLQKKKYDLASREKMPTEPRSAKQDAFFITEEEIVETNLPKKIVDKKGQIIET